MDKTLLISGILLTTAFLLTDCNGGYPDPNEAADTNKITFTVGSYQEVGDDEDLPTRTSIQNVTEFVWAAGDTVGIYPNTGAQVYFAMEGGAGAKSAVFDGGGWALRQSSKYYSYYPFIGNIYLDRHKIPVSYTGQRQTGTTGIDHIGPYDYMYTPGSESDNGSLNFNYKHLGCILRPKLTLPAGKYIKLAITAPSNVFVKSGWFDLQSDSPAIIGTEYSNQIMIDLDGVSVDGSTTFLVYVMSAPVSLKDKKITVSVLNDQKKEFQCTKTPSSNYNAGAIGGLTCTKWTEVPQSMGMIIDGWGNGGDIGGDAE